MRFIDSIEASESAVVRLFYAVPVKALGTKEHFTSMIENEYGVAAVLTHSTQ
jgi:hypothetical protein